MAQVYLRRETMDLLEREREHQEAVQGVELADAVVVEHALRELARLRRLEERFEARLVDDPTTV